jgi:spore maturation protein CgeB
MLNKAVCVTDDSTYLLEQYTNHNDLVFYSLEHVDELPILIEDLLQHPSKAKVLIENGYRKAMDYHTWSHRAKTISDMIL